MWRYCRGHLPPPRQRHPGGMIHGHPISCLPSLPKKTTPLYVLLKKIHTKHT
eukprot:COSAG01_NODE_51172_length_357_cov_0.500000_2_plen_51_part_01